MLARIIVIEEVKFGTCLDRLSPQTLTLKTKQVLSGSIDLISEHPKSSELK